MLKVVLRQSKQKSQSLFHQVLRIVSLLWALKVATDDMEQPRIKIHDFLMPFWDEEKVKFCTINES